jgi:hypothetical protein
MAPGRVRPVARAVARPPERWFARIARRAAGSTRYAGGDGQGRSRPQGTRLPLQKSYRRVKTVNLTLQDDGGSAATLKVLDKDEVQGPLVRAFDAAGQGATATIDATVQGY